MRSTIFAGTMPASAFGTAPRRSAVIAKCTPSGRPSATRRGSASTSSPRLTRSNAADEAGVAVEQDDDARGSARVRRRAVYSASVNDAARARTGSSAVSSVRRSIANSRVTRSSSSPATTAPHVRQRLEHAAARASRSRARRGGARPGDDRSASDERERAEQRRLAAAARAVDEHAAVRARGRRTSGALALERRLVEHADRGDGARVAVRRLRRRERRERERRLERRQPRRVGCGGAAARAAASTAAATIRSQVGLARRPSAVAVGSGAGASKRSSRTTTIGAPSRRARVAPPT